MSRRRTYRRLAALAAVLLAQPPGHGHHGYDLRRASGVRSGRLYPLLTAMLRHGWLTDTWTPAGRRGYRLTAWGHHVLRTRYGTRTVAR